MTVRSDEIQAGGFLLVALVLLVISIYTLGAERQLFGSRKSFHAVFSDIKGLREGAPVRLGGIAVGRVGQVRFSSDPSSTDVAVAILIDERFVDRIRKDTKAVIDTQGLLGDRYLRLETGESLELLAPGETLSTFEPADIGEVLTSAGVIVDNTKALTGTLREVLDDLRADGIENLTASFAALNNILSEVQSGSGTLHHLIYAKPDDENIVDSLQQAAQDIQALTSAVRNSEGVLGSLIFDPAGAEIVQDVRLTVQSLRETSVAISTIAEFFTTSDGEETVQSTEARELLANLNESVKNLRIATQALSEAQGTLGALLFDSRLYDQALAITEGANKSFLLREAIRASMPR